MIRSIFYSLSVVFFSLAILITYKAVKDPGDYSSAISLPPELTMAPTPAYSPPAPPTPFSDIANNETPLPSTHTVTEETRTAVTQYENPPNISEEMPQNAVDNKPGGQSRTLIIFSGRTFRSGQDVIQDVAYSTIENLVKEINASPGGLILIEGHTDNIPTGKIGSDNLELSARRAKAIANILMLHGIPPQRISIKGYGDTRPIDSNNTEEGRAKNRRVEIKLIPKEGNI